MSAILVTCPTCGASPCADLYRCRVARLTGKPRIADDGLSYQERVARDAGAMARLEGRDLTRAPDSVQPAHTCDGGVPVSAHEDHPVALTIFWPDRWRASPPVGVSLTETWAGLVRWASWPVVLDAKDAAGGYVLARLRDGVRKVDHVISVSCLSLDVDHGDVPASALHEALSRFAHLVYSTHSSTPAAPRSRVILPFTRPATPAEYAALWPHVARLMEAAGVPLDKSTRDPARLWFVPAVKPGAVFEVYEGTGELLDVDRLLAAARASAPVRPPRASAPAGYVRGGAPASGDRPFDTANALDPRAVAQWLGLYDGKRVRCPGCGEKQGVDVIDHGLKCFHNRCSDKGLSGFRTIVDLTSEVLSVDKFEAVNALAQRFGFSRRPS